MDETVEASDIGTEVGAAGLCDGNIAMIQFPLNPQENDKGKYQICWKTGKATSSYKL